MASMVASAFWYLITLATCPSAVVHIVLSILWGLSMLETNGHNQMQRTLMQLLFFALGYEIIARRLGSLRIFGRRPMAEILLVYFYIHWGIYCSAYGLRLFYQRSGWLAIVGLTPHGLRFIISVVFVLFETRNGGVIHPHGEVEVFIIHATRLDALANFVMSPIRLLRRLSSMPVTSTIYQWPLYRVSGARTDEAGNIDRIKLKAVQAFTKPVKVVLRDEDDICCPFCLQGHAINDTVIILPCGHPSHDQCLRQWWNTKMSCVRCTKLYKWVRGPRRQSEGRWVLEESK